MSLKALQRGWRRKTLLVLPVIMIAAAGCFFIADVIKERPSLTYEDYTGDEAAASYPDVEFAVLSDLHFYDTSLGTQGAAFEEELASDRKLLLDSEELLAEAVSRLEGSEEKAAPRFVLVSGDLTKDGERINHERVAACLQELTDRGVKVFVVPGNHDINNPDAVRYSGDSKERVNTVTDDEFAHIYAGMGYGDALMRDEHSLSYVAEPLEGLWIVGIDACRYRENPSEGEGIISGAVSQETEGWLAEVLGQAVAQGKAVIALMHHGVVEHWQGQAKLHGDYLVREHQYFGAFLASYHVRVVFTGHYHAQDISRGDYAGGSLYDVETGSLLTAPCPVRFCTIRQNTLEIESVTLADKLHPDSDFADEAVTTARDSVVAEAYKTIRKYKVSEEEARYLAEVVGDAFMAHYSGDEDPADRMVVDESRLSLWGRFIFAMQKYVLEGLWTDLPTPDGQAVLPL